MIKKNSTPFWVTKRLPNLSKQEWEQLCDGCGKCCLNKLEDFDDGTIYYTDVVCRYLDQQSCRCTVYAERLRKVADCVALTSKSDFSWMPASCAYRRLAAGRDLPVWHPLLTGDRIVMDMLGYSIRNRVRSESDGLELEAHVVEWPQQDSP